MRVPGLASSEAQRLNEDQSGVEGALEGSRSIQGREAGKPPQAMEEQQGKEIVDFF